MTITLTPKQQKIVDDAVAAVREGRDFSVTGLAGTGKTVVLCMLFRALRDAGFTPQACAPTGKAAQNITKKFPELAARTLHSALSQSVTDRIKDFYDKLDELTKKRDLWKAWNETPEAERVADGEAPTFTDEEAAALEELPKTIRKLRENIDTRLDFTAKARESLAFDVLLFDEASMIGEKIYYDLIDTIDMPKVFFGDFGQLPPIKDEPAIDLRNADAVLDEVHRQKGDSGILKVAYAVNKGQRIKPADFTDCSDITIIGGDDYSLVLPYADTHQVVVWQNKDRHALNLLLREKKLGIRMGSRSEDWIPQPGEELICDQNSKNGLFNGDPLLVLPKPEKESDVPAPRNPYMRDIWIRRVGDPVENVKRVRLNLANLMPPQMELGNPHEREDAERFGFKAIWSYAITCHKAQGSEYPHVVVFRPSTIPQDRDRWLYTAVTRASQSLVLIGPEFNAPKAQMRDRNGRTFAERLAAAKERKSA
jgi:exodeoxyribonuclease-5